MQNLKERPCLSCQTKFLTTPSIRICPACKKKAPREGIENKVGYLQYMSRHTKGPAA